jgi:hypothetical protein
MPSRDSMTRLGVVDLMTWLGVAGHAAHTYLSIFRPSVPGAQLCLFVQYQQAYIMISQACIPQKVGRTRRGHRCGCGLGLSPMHTAPPSDFSPPSKALSPQYRGACKLARSCVDLIRLCPWLCPLISPRVPRRRVHPGTGNPSLNMCLSCVYMRCPHSTCRLVIVLYVFV